MLEIIIIIIIIIKHVKIIVTLNSKLLQGHFTELVSMSRADNDQ